MLDPLIAVAWSTKLEIFLVKVKTKQVVSPNRDLEFVPLTECTTLHPIKGLFFFLFRPGVIVCINPNLAMKWIGKILILVLQPASPTTATATSAPTSVTDLLMVYDPLQKEELEEREMNDSLVFHLRYAAADKQKELQKQQQQQQEQGSQSPAVIKYPKKVRCFF